MKVKANHDLKQILKILWTLVKKPDWLPFAPPIKPSWSSKADVGDWLNNTPTLGEDGAHPYLSPFYFEWWYFDVNFGESSALSVIFHLTDLFRPASSTGSINVSILSRGKKVYHRFVPYSRERIHASSEQCDVWIGENHCWEEKGIYYLRMSEQNLDIELQFTPSCVG